MLEYRKDKFIFRVAEGYLYNPWNDIWACIKVKGMVVRIGLTDYAAQNIGDIVSIELPGIGKKLSQMDELATIESVKAVSDVLAPVGGKIIKINDQLNDEPELINLDPYGEGWIAEIEADNLEEDSKVLVDSREYFEIIKDKIEQKGEK